MGKRRGTPGRHRRPTPPAVRMRYRRVAGAGAAFVVTAVALAGGLMLRPVVDDPPAPLVTSQLLDNVGSATGSPATTGTARSTDQTGPEERAGAGAAGRDQKVLSGTRLRPRPAVEPRPTTLPADSGQGKRIVYHRGDQRVWLVGPDETVLRTYLVSGSLYNNLNAGSYAVYSRSRYARGIGNSGEMEYFVRFARGANAAIGFHDIPTKDGVPLQTAKELGTPQSHGCVRQERDNAVALWNFAPIGTNVVVL